MRRFEHAAASRSLAEAVVTRMEFSDGAVGWGETLPRPYVTGETIDSVIADLRDAIWPARAEWSYDDWPGLGRIAAGCEEQGRCMNAAVCAFELAAAWRVFALLPRAALRANIPARVSGVIGSSDPARTASQLRWLRRFGLRDFKIKLGLADEVDRENLRLVWRRLREGIAAGKCTLRVDVNGSWQPDTAAERVNELARYGVCVVEQPIRGPAEDLLNLARRCELPLMADESLLGRTDAETLLAEPARIWWNIRISKLGGFARSMELAQLAAARGVNFVIGCMVGESGILSAAQRRLLQLVDQPRFVEGNYDGLLLRGDLTTRRVRWGYGGRLGARKGRNFGVKIDLRKLAGYGTLAATLV